MNYLLTIPYIPPVSLSPNGRAHWAKRNRDFQELKRYAWAEARASRVPTMAAAVAEVTFYTKARRKRDGDNWLARTKAIWDGLVAAGVLPNDDTGHLSHRPVRFEVDAKRPRTEVRLWPL